jgi:hypothetical protein
MADGRERVTDRHTAESQLSELQNARPSKGALGISRNLAYHRRVRLEARIDEDLDEVDCQMRALRTDRV